MKLYSNITYIFIIWVILVVSIAFLGFSTIPHSAYFSNNFWESLGNWDGGHYTGIAKAGYGQKFQYAFFPLYPLVIKLMSQITQNYLVAAIIISLSSTFLGLHFLYKLITLDFDKKIAEKTVLAFILFPTSFFLITAYSEGLFFFLTVTAFYFLRQNKLFWAVLAVALASATRFAGLAVAAALLIDVGIRQGFNRRNWYIFLAPLGFVIYCIFLYKQTGDPFYFITAENHWQRVLTVPGVGFWETIRNIVDTRVVLPNFNVFLDLIFAVFGVGLAIRSFRFLPASFAIYSLISVSIPLFTPTLSSIPRFLLMVFPIFVLMALVKNHYLQLIFQTFSIALLAFFTILFFSGYWVA